MAMIWISLYGILWQHKTHLSSSGWFVALGKQHRLVFIQIFNNIMYIYIYIVCIVNIIQGYNMTLTTHIYRHIINNYINQQVGITQTINQETSWGSAGELV